MTDFMQIIDGLPWFEIFAHLNVMLGIATIVGLGAVAWGFRGHLWSSQVLLRHFSRGLVWLAASFGLRMIYWDVFFTWFELVDPERWAAWAAITGGTNVNIIFLSMTFCGAYHTLNALLHLVPEGERFRWRWWNVAIYPARGLWRR